VKALTAECSRCGGCGFVGAGGDGCSYCAGYGIVPSVPMFGRYFGPSLSDDAIAALEAILPPKKPGHEWAWAVYPGRPWRRMHLRGHCSCGNAVDLYPMKIKGGVVYHVECST